MKKYLPKKLIKYLSYEFTKCFLIVALVFLSISLLTNFVEELVFFKDKQIENFVMYYERITKHMLKTLPKIADTVISIDEEHRLKSIRFN